jgi:hypothetical protein
MKEILKIALFFALLLAGFGASAQTMKNFTHTQDGYLKEVGDMLIEADKKTGKPFMDEMFIASWNSTRFNDASRNRIYKISDELLKKRLKVYPEFFGFFYALAMFAQSDQDDASFNSWLTIMEKLVQDKKKRYLTDFIDNSATIFEDNTFYKSPSTAWQSSSGKYTFEYDSIPKVVFNQLDLRCLAKNDSAVIYGTKGIYYPTQGKFVGQGGRITWERAGLDKNETYAIIENEYEIRVKGSGFTIDSVLFFNAFFDHPLRGVVTDKVLANVKEDKASYPSFESYNKRLQIRDIVKDMDYEGGFSMRGNKLLGYGTPEELARITIYREGYAFLVAKSLNFTIGKDRIISEKVGLTIYLDTDSIIHPAVNFKFMKEDRMLTLIKNDEGLSKSPYFNSFHMVDMYFEALYWKIDDPLMKFGNLFGSTVNRAAFESFNYFKMQRYDAIQGMAEYNPLFKIREYARSINAEEFGIEGLASHMRYPVEQIIPVIIDMANKGFIYYDVERRWITTKERLFNYILASGGKVDYDILVFNSEANNITNASLNLLNYDMLLNGVKTINMSDSQNVIIYPQNGEVLLKRNRDFNFAGVIKAGRFEFFGKEYNFHYDAFKIDLINVDSCRFYVDHFDDRKNPEKKDNPRLVRVKNVLEGIRGVISIDNPYNKSGIQPEYTNYPIFDCTKKPFVFYDNKRIQKGVYNRDNFYFHVEPFTLDSLDDFKVENVYFDGTLVSSGIFPDIPEKLKVQQDYSLGFVRQTGGSGLPLYAGKAKYTDEITLNYKGLQGDGDIAYLSSVSGSDNYVFFPDSTRGVTNSFVNRAQGGPPPVPDASATAVDLTFLPKADRMTFDVMKESIAFFNGQSNLTKGSATLTPQGMEGTGIMAFSDAELETDLMKFKQMSFTADTSDFRLAAMDQSGMAFATSNVKADVNFETRIAQFESNGDDTFVEFPVNQYICYMDKFKWFMDQNSIELESSKATAADFVIDTELDLARSNFFSTHPEQDSLSFMAPKAVYDLAKNIIDAKEIDHIRVADAKIIPENGSVRILRKAYMEPLINAKVVANYVTQHHTINNANLEIKAKRRYYGRGEYNYIDENKKTSILVFDKIYVDTTFQTVATGQIKETDQFALSPSFEFIGLTRLEANKKFLTFKGSTRIAHNCPGIERNFMNFESEINPDEVMIPMDTMLLDYSGKPVGVGAMVRTEPFKLYSTFLSVKQDAEDEEVLSARGFLFFDKKSRQYQVASRDKLRDKKLPGNFVALDIDKCELLGDGAVNMGNSLGQVKFIPVGEVKHKMAEDDFSINASVVIDFFFLEDALKKMEEKINSYPDLKPVDITKTYYEKSIRQVMGLEKSDKLISELTLSGTIKRLPNEMINTLYLADLKLKWSELEGSFRSDGPIGIAHIGKKDVFRYTKGYVELEKAKSGDVLHIYLELDEANWYYFTYKRGLMRVFSSDNDFNNLILEVKDDKRKAEGKGGEAFTYMLGTKKMRNDFIGRFE